MTTMTSVSFVWMIVFVRMVMMMMFVPMNPGIAERTPNALAW